METKEREAGRAGPPEERSVRMPRNRVVTTRVAAERTGWAYSLFEVEVGEGGGEGPHVQHREDEWLYVLEGRFDLVVEGAASEAGPGTHVYVPEGALHAYENVADRMGRLLVVHTPGGPQESFLAAADELADGPAARPDRNGRRFAPIAAEHGIEICGTTEKAERSF